jgi:hypothetical protein
MTRPESTTHDAVAISRRWSLDRAGARHGEDALKNSMIASRSPDSAKPFWCIALAMSLACINASCGRNDDSNLWRRTFATAQRESAVRGQNRLTGYWEGEVAMGNIRAKIESGKITISMKCNSDGSSVAQGTAATIVSNDVPAKIILQANLDSAGDDACGFHFYKGNEFVYTFERPDLLKINFAGSAVSELKKLADLDLST